jgi:proteasome lid subunit RPN8/RPN11
VKIAPEMLAQIVEHALESPRIECCGIVAVGPREEGPQRTAKRVYRAENIHASALKFEIEPIELFRLNEAIEAEGWEIGAIYHSHVRSAPFPSQTDVGFAAGWPGLEWVIVGLAGGGEPDVRSYLIEDADVREVPIDDSAEGTRG